MRHVTKNPPKILIEAMVIAMKLNIDTSLKTELEPKAIIAPTTMTPEIAFVTAIKGVCRAGVTFQTTK